MKPANKEMLFVCLFSIIGTSAWAQQTGKVTGRITDEQHKALEFSSISLLKAADSTLVKGGLADLEGKFEFEQVPAGTYTVVVSRMSYKRTYTPAFVVDESHLNVQAGDITLAAESQQLGEVNVVAKKPFIEQQLDRIVVNVDASVVSAGSTALEVLEKSPGVYVDKDGGISLKGKSNVLVLIDDKPTYMSASDLANTLKNLQASQVDKIEIMTNPPAKYDAAGNAGVINIKSKKLQNVGLNGTFNAGARLGLFERSNGKAVNYLKEQAGLNLNYRQGKLNLYGSLAGDNGKSPQTQYITRRFTGSAEEGSTSFEQLSEKTVDNRSISYKGGLDYYLTPKTTLGVLFSGLANDNKQYYDSDTRIQHTNAALDTAVFTRGQLNNIWLNNSANLNLKHIIDSTGQEITVDMNYALFDNDNTQQYRTTKFDQQDVLRQVRNEDGLNTSNILVRVGKIDYTRPLPGKGHLDLGVKSSWVTSKNSMNFFFLNSEARQPLVDPQRTRDFEYRENIHAGYVNYAQQFGQLSVQLGLRAENTNGQGKLQGKELVKRNYTSLFPSAFLSQKLSDNHQIGFSYSRRIDRPSYEDLNPFLYFLDPYTFNRGNEQLQPQFTNAVELSHTYKSGITTTLNYSKTTGVMSDFLQQNNALKITYLTELNIGTLDNYGVAVSLPWTIAKWWDTNTYFNLYRNHYYGDVPGVSSTGTDASITQRLDKATTSWSVNTSQQFDLPGGYSAELSGFYISRIIDGQFSRNPLGAVSVGLQKPIMHEKAMLKLNVSDVFWTNYPNGGFNSPGVDVAVRSRRESRSARLTFSYRFGNTKVAASRQRKTGLEEERGRIKNAGN
ncbi:TonB-dependent receptor [Hymenobacter sp. BT635]|uniref:TonB-dependent receptor n=1 Tax=Hymenobacter nitidus TaxID=2880929 RepID=A0ABS8A863_9BACT|nr:outer membrane beta-barrel family protein [Hymenobacter nitidus]MCB2376590.1 TonB-dependent receptor [Hymenobacter nitidus]